MMVPRVFSRSLSVLAALVLALVLSACSVTPNYLAETGPRYAGAYASVDTPDDGRFKALTWNIKFSRNIDAAIRVFQQTPELQNPDVILLQEMDEEGVERMARALQMNYVYYPASIHVRHGRDFGQALLSPWPLTDDRKIILPYYSPRNGQIRIAVAAWVQTPGRPVLALNTHTETSLMTPAQRIAQVQAILAEMGEVASPAIIGGDFNTVTPWEQRALLALMEQAGWSWMTREAGPTVVEMGAGVTMDYLFARGMEPLATGVVSDVDVSDHLPLWAEMGMGE